MCKYFFPFWDVSLYSHINVFRRSNVLNIDKVQGNIVPFMNHDFGVLKNLCLVKEQRDFLFPRSIHFELTFLSGMRYGSRSVFCIWLFNSSSTIYRKKVYFANYLCLSLKINWPCMCESVSELSTPHNLDYWFLSRYPCLVLDLRWKAFNLSLLNMKLQVFHRCP